MSWRSKLRQAWFGDLLASLFVGCCLFLGYVLFYWAPWLPVGIGYLAPLLVYRFSTFWNGRPFSRRRAVLTAFAMGTFFGIVHYSALPHWVISASGFLAPLLVSWWARQSVSEADEVRHT